MSGVDDSLLEIRPAPEDRAEIATPKKDLGGVTRCSATADCAVLVLFSMRGFDNGDDVNDFDGNDDESESLTLYTWIVWAQTPIAKGRFGDETLSTQRMCTPRMCISRFRSTSVNNF